MLNRLLPEEVTLNDIKGRIVEAGVNFEASQIGDADEREEGAKVYRETLNKAVTEVGTWEEVVQAKIEQVGWPWQRHNTET
jgi:hypothetical protein